MPENAVISFTVGPLPSGFCPANEQERANAIGSVLSGFLPGNYSTFNFGSVEPSVDNRDKPWFKLNPDGSPAGWQVYFNGAWVRGQPLDPPPGVIVDYYGALADIPALNGGTVPNPYYRVCDGTNGTPDLRGSTSIGATVGTVPALRTGISARNVGDFVGEETHTLILAETPDIWPANVVKVITRVSSGGTSSIADNPSGPQVDTGIVKPSGGNLPHNNMQPSVALWKIMRTTRLF